MMTFLFADETPRRRGCEFVLQVHDEHGQRHCHSEQHAGGGQCLRVGPKEMVRLLQALRWRYSTASRLETVCMLHGFFFCFILLLKSITAAGKQYLRYGCRRKVDSKMVHKSFCNKSNMKPRGDIRDCNQKPCPPPMYVMELWNRAVTVDAMRPRISSDVLCFFFFLCIVLQLGDRGVAELQQALRENGDASPLGQLRSAAGRQHHTHHPQQAL